MYKTRKIAMHIVKGSAHYKLREIKNLFYFEIRIKKTWSFLKKLLM